MSRYVYLDHASTTSCLEDAAEVLKQFSCPNYGNPSSNHQLGRVSAQAIRDARAFFGEQFDVPPEQVIFTGSGSEANNLAIYGPLLPHLRDETPARILTSRIEHPAIKNTVLSVKDLGAEINFIPVDSEGQLRDDKLLEALSPATRIVSLMRVNNIVGSSIDVESLAAQVKEKYPDLIFHTDAVQAFGKVNVPRAGSPIDLVSISAHKIKGPKGVGALIVLNPTLLREKKIRPLIWGGGQESGLRSGTPNPGLIAAFHVAARYTIENRERFIEHAETLRKTLRETLLQEGILAPQGKGCCWNSPDSAVPYIVSLGFPGTPSNTLAQLLEEAGYLVATGSACSSAKSEPDHVLCALGKSPAVQISSLRISFGLENTVEQIQGFGKAVSEAYRKIQELKS